MAGASAGVWDCHVALLLVTALGLGQRLHPKPGLSSLGYSYDCGVKGLQLRVLPQSGQTVRFKVVDEFGNQFEVNNCSACYHWVSTKPRAPAVFSAGYKGCHVLEKDGRSHLTVFTEAVLPDGRVDATRDVALICPKPGHGWTPASHPEPPVGFSLPTPQAQPLRPIPEHSFVRATPALPSLGPGPATHPTQAQPQWGTLEHGGLTSHLTQTHPLWSEKFRGSLSAGGCCYDNGREVPCYYGNTATVQCFRNGHFVLVVSRETALAHGITLANIHMAYAPTSCSLAQQTGSFVVFRFPFSHCGTTVQVAGNQLIYENQLVSDIKAQTGPQGSITRDGTFRLHVCCVFNASDFLPLRASIFLPPSPAPVTQSGPLQLQLRIAKDESFRSHYEEGDYPLVRLLRQPVPVEVRLLQRTDPSLVLLLHQCWATPGANPFQQPQWLLLSDGCPFDCDSYRTQLVALDEAELSFPSRYQHFPVATSALLDPGSQRPLRGWVYFFCSVSACSPSELETCRTVCSSGLASFPRNANPGPLLWVVLLLVAVALVLGVGVFVRLSRAQHRSSRKAMEGEGAQ